MKRAGKPEVRRDGRAKVTGAARYANEVQVAEVVYGVMVTSRVAKGTVSAIDTTEALLEPGVIAVLTPFNAMKLPGGLGRVDGERVVQALQDNAIHYSNQPIAMAVAETFEGACRAALQVKVIEVAAPMTVRMEDEKPNAFPHELMAGGNAIPADQSRGSLEQGLGLAAAKVGQTYRTPPEMHNPMEPHATLAVWTRPGQLTLYDSTQGIYGVRKQLASCFAVPLESVRVITKFVGGGFGGKGSPWSHVFLAALAARQLGRPVKVALSRTQMFGMVGGRPQTEQHLVAAATKGGVLTALEHVSYSTTSRFDEFLETAAQVSQHTYACPNVETKHRLVRLDIGTPTYMRAPGESSGSFALESALDELAHQLGRDPLQLRLDNYAESDPADGKPFSSKSLRDCYRIGAETFGWSRRNPKPRAKVEDGRLVGLGMATASYPANQARCDASVRFEADGTVLVQSGAVDLGTGTYTVNAQVAAEALGVEFEQVRFDLGDSDMPEAPRSGGSITAASTSSAIEAACALLKTRMAELSAADSRSPLYGLLGVHCEDGMVKAGAKSDPFVDIARRNGGRVEAKAHVEPGLDRKKFSLHSFGAQFAEVRVDPDLGMVQVVRLTACFAAGRILNERLARSQLMGGMVWGIGMALHEQCVYDEKLGRIMTQDLSTYHVPTQCDVVQLEPLFLPFEADEHVAPSGVKGLGEIGITGAAAAIANAVFNATGVRVRSLPITPDKLIV
jgi:xanthine dehydrogenase YagR molybdenum-binding subunit